MMIKNKFLPVGMAALTCLTLAGCSLTITPGRPKAGADGPSSTATSGSQPRGSETPYGAPNADDETSPSDPDRVFNATYSVIYEQRTGNPVPSDVLESARTFGKASCEALVRGVSIQDIYKIISSKSDGNKDTVFLAGAALGGVAASWPSLRSEKFAAPVG